MLLIKGVSLLHSPALLSFWVMRPPAHKYMYLYYLMGKGIQISIYVLNWKIHLCLVKEKSSSFFRFYVLITLQHMHKNLNRNKVFENTCIPLLKSRSILSICVSEIIQRAWWILGLSWRLGLCVLNIVHLISFLVANQYEWPCVEYIHVIPCIKYWNRVINFTALGWYQFTFVLQY